MATVNFGPYAPDRASSNAAVIPYVNNMVPTEDGYGPLPAIVPTPAVYQNLYWDDGTSKIQWDNGDNIIIALDWSDITGFLALPGNCIGFFAARKRDGTEAIFAGTATALYKFRTDQCVWEDVSSTTYDAACRWSFAKFGDVVYCQNGNDTEQKFDIENDTVFSDNAGAPICKYLLVVESFLFRLNIVSWAAEPQNVGPAMLMCSAFENPQDNIVQNANWCDFQGVPVGDEIVGAITVSGGAHIWLRGGVVPMSVQMSGGVTFTLGAVDATRGSSAPYSICSFGQDQYLVYCDDGYWLYDGGFSPIGQGRVNKTFLRTVDQNTFEDILSMNDPENAVIWISYTNRSAQRRMLGFQYNIREFTASDIEVQASFVCRTFTYADSDPPITVANQPRFTIIDGNGRLGYMVGEALAASLRTNKLQYDVDRSFTNRAQLNGDALAFTLTPSTQDIKGGPSRTRSPASPSARSGNVPIRTSGRTHELELNIEAGDPWTYVAGVEVAVKRAGRS